jgi:TatD DNase family protein
MLVDSHCHLDFPDFENELDDIVGRAAEAGIGYMLTICTRLDKFDPIRSLAESYDNMSCSVGVHPHNVADGDEVTLDDLLALADHPKVIGIGETGLDFYYDNAPRDIQERCFRTHIAAARETQLPIIVHTRDADDETVRILREEYEKGAFPGLIHCFSAGPELAASVLDMDFYISVSGIITFKSAEPIRKTVANVPIERILVETDAPYLAPIPKRGRRNEPAYTAYTATRVAELKEMDEVQFAQQTSNNFFRLFTKAPDVRNG